MNKSRTILRGIGAALAVMLTVFSAYAVRESKPTSIDPRIRVIVYSPYDVFKFTGYYGYQTSIELAPDEEVVSISMGDTTAWQIVPSGFRIFIKPIDADATTNMTLTTNKRTYFFELYAAEAADIRDPNMVFNVRFIYPQDEEDSVMSQYSSTTSASSLPDLTRPERYNFNYTISGNEAIAPIKIYDDGEFTYLQFRDKNAEIPAIFAVDEELREAMVNYHLSTDGTNIVVVEQVFPKLSVRLGKKIVCIFNESLKQKK